ncbi:thymidine kinase [Synechococcus sp. CS-1331]|uniref:thymidine kinase n=1 Tax=Synechococcus sp. CS-1331 TaxID=2847973 RepID=UPI00223BAD5F|nr:thymidine kinase [Synechococcus sp. CS-1331]MCT0229244.1 thymidine kinase [Synechococcus sp. CS-1331]
MISQFAQDTGWIEVICGSMYSGKTEELIRRLKRALYGQQRVQVFKPEIDNRYDELAVVSHSQLKISATSVQNALQILQAVAADTKVVGIDEVQFFGMELVSVVQVLASRGLRVICAGLDQDYQGKPFEPMPQLLAIAELITKELAICVVCGNPANRSQRLAYSEERVVVGAAGAYEARCRKCHVATAVAATPGQEIDLFNN